MTGGAWKAAQSCVSLFSLEANWGDTGVAGRSIGSWKSWFSCFTFESRNAGEAWRSGNSFVSFWSRVDVGSGCSFRSRWSGVSRVSFGAGPSSSARRAVETGVTDLALRALKAWEAVVAGRAARSGNSRLARLSLVSLADLERRKTRISGLSCLSLDSGVAVKSRRSREAWWTRRTSGAWASIKA